MSISFNHENGQFKLDTKDTSYIFCKKDGFLLHLYWGARIGDCDCTYMFREQGRAAFSPRMERCCGFILDDVPMEFPCWGRGDMRSPAVEIINPDGSNICDLRYLSHSISHGKPRIQGLPSTYVEDKSECDTLVVTLRDDVSGVEADLYYCVYGELGIITRYVNVHNTSDKDVKINKLMSASVDFDHNRYDVISNYGTHCRERGIERFKLNHGDYVMDVRRGASSHVHNPFVIMCDHTADELSGNVYGMLLAYSGSFTARVSSTQFDTVRMQIGLNEREFGWVLHPGEVFRSPEAILCCSTNGFDEFSYRLHTLLRTRMCRGKYRDIRRPVLLNSWEACYFSFDNERLKKIANSCADLGFELMVIDDGWFGRRDSDNCSLGDWVIDKRKFPNGIKEISDLLHSRGVGLGIWFEPEMVSPDSDLYRAHPDWCLHINGRPRSEGRQQLILDLGRPEVRDYLFDSMSAVLSDGSISYVKWDFNRNMTEVGSDILPAERQCETTHRYYLGLYDLLERLTSAFPDVLFESCSGGGGRFDAGMLYYMPQVWTSDNSDAIERLKIQYGTSLCYPMSAMSAHISASPNHQTAHVTPYETRQTVALTGSFGFELDPTQMPDDERSRVTDSIELFKKYGDILQKGRCHRLRSPYDGDCSAWCTVSEDKSVCIAGYVLTHVRMYGNNERIVLRGLDPDATYREVFTGEIYRGDQLMGFGFHVPNTLEYTSKLCIFERV